MRGPHSICIADVCVEGKAAWTRTLSIIIITITSSDPRTISGQHTKGVNRSDEKPPQNSAANQNNRIDMVSHQSSSSTNNQLLRIRSPAGTSRITVEPTTSGEEFIEKILAGIPPSDPQPDLATVRLSNQPSSTAESVSFDALKGRTVGDMGFGYVQY